MYESGTYGKSCIYILWIYVPRTDCFFAPKVGFFELVDISLVVENIHFWSKSAFSTPLSLSTPLFSGDGRKKFAENP